MKKWLYLSVLCLGLVHCTGSESEKSVAAIDTDGKIASIIRNPVSANEPIDTVNVARIEFEEASFNFGEVGEGAIVKHSFKFTNTGKVPLLISNVRSTCGCTVSTWPKEAIGPGETSEINAEFNTTNKMKEQKKPVIVTANTYPLETKAYLIG
ncbi:MAG: DUF1573 domain-containing protein, partial [Bacteroidota bacterium]